MTENLKDLCCLNGVSGCEDKVREYIIDEIKDYAEITVDPLGNVLAFVKGKHRAAKKIMADAHMDEVGFIVSCICDDGMLKFATVGGINTAAMLCRRVVFDNGVKGVISLKPIHLLTSDEKEKMPEQESLYIDIGCDSKAEAEALVSLGDCAFFDEPFERVGDMIVSKAIDDRAGCAVLIDIIKSNPEYDFYASFSVREEIGAGAVTAAYNIDPDIAFVIEATTAADIAGVPDGKKVCFLNKGATVSFMDRGTLYDKALFDGVLATAEEKGINCQVKQAVAGGNNAAGIHKTRGGIRTAAISVPCRYIHSGVCTAAVADIESVRDLAAAVIEKAAEGKL